MKKSNRFNVIILIIGISLGFILSKSINIRVDIHPKVRRVLSKIKEWSPPGKKHHDEILELCYFEKTSDIKKIEKTSVHIERSREQVSQGKYSLKCIFPDGGAAVGFYDVLPKNWMGYSSFKFDVYSENGGIPLSLFIADTNNISYYDRYNYENILLKKGWNNIELSVSEIDKKLIIDKINHLNIFLWQVKGKHTLYFDNIRLINKKLDANKPIDSSIKITVYPAKDKGKISRLLYGTNLGPKMESDEKIKHFIKDAGITCFRYPGGGSPGWHWKTETADYNPKVKDMFLGGVDYLIKFCRETNTQLIIQVNIESGTPKEAAELVEYLNKKVGFPVKYWELGNEVYGKWDKAYMNANKYAQVIKEYSTAMKTVDPTIKIGANWGGRHYDKTQWDRTIIKKSADYIDFVSIHWYPNHVNKRHKYEGRIHPTPGEIMANPEEIPTIIQRVHKIIEKYAPHRKEKIEVAFLEWDGTWDAPPSNPTPPYAQGIVQWSLANAIFHADCLGQFAKNKVIVSTHFNLQECMFGLIRGWNRAEGWGGMPWNGETIRPKAFATEIFSKYFEDIFIESDVDNSPCYYKSQDWWPSSYKGKVPYITCYASKSNNGSKIAIILINKHTSQDFDVNILLDGLNKKNKVCDVWLLTGPDIMSQNENVPGTVMIKKATRIDVSNEFRYTLPMHSVVAMRIEL